MTLSDVQRSLLDFRNHWWQLPQSKDVGDPFPISVSRRVAITAPLYALVDLRADGAGLRPAHCAAGTPPSGAEPPSSDRAAVAPIPGSR